MGEFSADFLMLRRKHTKCIYILIVDDLGATQIHLLLANSKVTPSKTVSLTELMEAVKANLKFDIAKTKSCRWTDSIIVGFKKHSVRGKLLLLIELQR